MRNFWNPEDKLSERREYDRETIQFIKVNATRDNGRPEPITNDEAISIYELMREFNEKPVIKLKRKFSHKQNKYGDTYGRCQLCDDKSVTARTIASFWITDKPEVDINLMTEKQIDSHYKKNNYLAFVCDECVEDIDEYPLDTIYEINNKRYRFDANWDANK